MSTSSILSHNVGVSSFQMQNISSIIIIGIICGNITGSVIYSNKCAVLISTEANKYIKPFSAKNSVSTPIDILFLVNLHIRILGSLV